MKRLPTLLIGLGGLVFAGHVNAQFLNGSLTAQAVPVDIRAGDATASSMAIFETNIVQSVTGTFNGIVSLNSLIQGFHPEIGGLSATPLTVSISNYLFFSQADTFLGYQAPGSNPQNRFEFNLDTLTEDSYDSQTGQALFTGTGTIVDIAGQYQDTAADLTVDFSSADTYSLTLQTVPEPASLTLMAVGILGLIVLRRGARRGAPSSR